MAWAKELGLDGRGMRFARDVRRQLEGVAGADGSGLHERSGGSSATRPAVGDHSALQAYGPLAMSLTHTASCVGKQ